MTEGRTKIRLHIMGLLDFLPAFAHSDAARKRVIWPCVADLNVNLFPINHSLSSGVVCGVRNAAFEANCVYNCLCLAIGACGLECWIQIDKCCK